jgi:DNA-binding response OmpR family regulator
MGAESQTIVVVEDDDSYRETLESTLRHVGYRVIGAPDGNVAMLRLRDELTPPALILLEWMMPAWNGLDFLASLESDTRHAEVPVLVLAEVAHAGRIPGTCVAAVVTKPVRTRTLLDVVGRLSGATLTARELADRTPNARTTSWRPARPPHGRVTAMIRKPVSTLDLRPTDRVRR